MLRQRLLTAVVAIALAVALGYGLIHLFALRLERGDVYPAYSTLRADPLGSRVLFESLAALPGIEVRRNYRPLQQLRPADPVTLIYAGLDRDAQWGREELRHFEALVANGSRAVFTFAPADLQAEKPKTNSEKATEDADKKSPAKESESKDEKPATGEKKPEAEKPTPRPSTISFSKVAERWGFRFDVAKAKRAGSYHGAANASEVAAGLEETVSWHSALRFADLQPTWRVLYRVAGEPVVIERRWGDGTIVLAANSFFMSNEALLNERSSRLLTWLIGQSRTLIFDEEHLGVKESTGLLSLARKYRLNGALAALALVGALWIWRQSVRFVPARAHGRHADEYVAGLDSHAGFVSLLRRTVPPARALDVCLDEWRKTFSHDKGALATVEQTLAEVAPVKAKKRDSVALYNAIAQALKQRKNR